LRSGEQGGDACLSPLLDHGVFGGSELLGGVRRATSASETPMRSDITRRVSPEGPGPHPSCRGSGARCQWLPARLAGSRRWTYDAYTDRIFREKALGIVNIDDELHAQLRKA